MGRTSVNKNTVRGWCNAVGNGIHHGAGRAYNTIKWFQRIEYASMYNQDAYTAQLTDEGYHQGGLGSGCSCDGNQWNTHNGYNPFIPCGVTLPLGNNTGKVSYTVKNWAGGGTDKVFQVTSYRGFGVPFEYLWMLADDSWYIVAKAKARCMYARILLSLPLTLILPQRFQKDMRRLYHCHVMEVMDL